MDRINELNAVFKKAVKEAYEKGLADGRKTVVKVVDEPKTVKRKARVGERILIVGDNWNGITFTVSDASFSGFSSAVDVEEIKANEDEWAFGRDEYEVIIEVEIPQQSVPKSPNQQRYETIQRAREFVESLKEKRGRSLYYIFGDDGHWCTPQFIVSSEKRAVITLLRWNGEGVDKIMSRGIAKCMPDDVFNSDIGKAIALARALEIEVPVEFLKAVQPDEVVVGMVVYDDETRHLNKTKVVIASGRFARNGECHACSVSAQRATIIDDSNAIYEGDSHE